MGGVMAGRLVLRAEPEVVRYARDGLREALEEAAVARSRREEALLLCSELVTNAIQHGSGWDDEVEVAWSIANGALRVAVVDAARGAVPVVLTPSEERSRGRGLRLVDQLADSWGERIVGGRREVAFHLQL